MSTMVVGTESTTEATTESTTEATTESSTPSTPTWSRRMAVDMAERMFWTFVAAFMSALVSPPIAQAAGIDLSLTAMQAALVAGTSAVMNFVTVIARWRLSVLPNPGFGLDGKA